MQLHILDLNFDSKSVAANIARLTAWGLQVHITELDVAITSEKDLARQAEIYSQVANVAYRIRAAGQFNLGIHRQIFLDWLVHQPREGRCPAFRSAISSETRVPGAD
jgi:GH35 family endo-1,4-beta-xylanase